MPYPTLVNDRINKRNTIEMIKDLWSSPKMSFNEFLEKAWEILEPSNLLIQNWHIELLCEYLSLVTDGKIQKLLINVPPRNGKSNIVTILWPAWSWTVRPSMRWIFCSYSASLSTKHSIDRRRVIESDWYLKNWGGTVRLSDDQNQKHEYENTARGHMISTSVGGTLTGKGGDVIVEDDMLNPMDADSEAARRHSLDMHKNVLSTRLDNPMIGARVIVEQRTHNNDVSGYVLKNEKGWTHVCLPLISEKKTVISFPVSKKLVIREPGSFLNSKRYGQAECNEMKESMGSRTFAAQAQQAPTSEAGNILKRGWWKFWNIEPESFDIMLQSWDMSFKETKSGSYVVGQVWKKRGPKYYLIDQYRARIDFTDAVQAVKTMSGKYPQAMAKLIEDAANGPAIISTLNSTISGIIPVSPQGSKAARAQSVAPLCEAGNIFIPNPEQTSWVHDFIEECAGFKGVTGETNDQVDAMSQAIIWLRHLEAASYNQLDDLSEESFIEQENFEFAGGFASV